MPRPAHDPSTIRTIALVGHRSSGKTSLGDLVLYTTGATRTLSRVDAGESLLDHDPESRARRTTLGNSFAWVDWEGYLVQIIDTPGADGLAYERELALSVVDGAVVVIDASDGLTPAVARVLQSLDRAGVPRIYALNRMDRPADPGLIGALEARATGRAAPVQVPFHDEDRRFCGVVDLVEQRVYRYALDGSGAFSAEPVPERMRDEVRARRERLVEAVAMTDDLLLERYMEEFDLPMEAIRAGLAAAVERGQLAPLVYVSAAAAIGAHPLLDLVAWGLPSPLRRRPPVALDAEGADVELSPRDGFVAQHVATRFDDDGGRFRVFRVWCGEPPRKGGWVHGETGRAATARKLYQLRGPRSSTARYQGPGALIATWEITDGRPGDTWTDGPRLVIGAPPAPPATHAWLLTPATPGDGERLPAALEVLCTVDPSLEVRACDVTGHPVLHGVGTDQLERALLVLRDRLGVAVTTSLPAVAYHESPQGVARAIEGVHRRANDGDVTEFALLTVDLQPGEDPADDNQVDWVVPDEIVPARFRAAAEEGIRRGLRRGPTAGYPVTGAVVRVLGGDYDILVSDDEHFRVAGERAARAALDKAGTRLLEPWSAVDVHVPFGEVGAVLAELGARRARITGLEVHGADASVRADCPVRELRTFGPRLQAITGGRGTFVSRPARHEPLPASLVKEAVAASPQRNG